MLRNILSIAAVALLASAATSANAITIAGVNISPGNVIINSSLLPNGSEHVFSGLVTLTSTGGKDFLGFCVDLKHDIAKGLGQNLSYTFGKLTNDFAGHDLTTDQTKQIFGLINFGSKSVDASVRGAVQTAIWTIEYGDRANFSTPSGFSNDGPNGVIDLVTRAQAGEFTGKGRVLQSLDGHQSFGVGGVPEPASWAMLITGFGMVGFAARKRNIAAMA